MSESDFVGTLTDDIAILSTDDAPSAPADTSTETSQPTSQTESSQQSERELTSDEITSLDSQRHQPKTPERTADKPQQTDQQQQASEKPQPEFEKPQADAETLEEQFPGGTEQAAQVISKAGELDSVDAALQSGTPADMAGVILNAFEQAGPERFPDVIQLALNLFEDRAPAQFDALVNSYIGERLKADGTWTALEYIYAQAKENPQAVPELLDRFSVYFTRYGLGPYSETAEATSLQEFTGAADEHIETYLNVDIQRQSPGFNAAPPELQSKFLQDVHSQVQQWAKGDPGLRSAVSNALRGGLTRRSGVQAVNLLVSKAQAVIPNAVKLVIDQPQYAVFRNAPPPPPLDPRRDTLTKEIANQLAPEQVMNWRGPVARQRPIGKQKTVKVTKDEARNMSFRRLLDDAIEVEP